MRAPDFWYPRSGRAFPLAATLLAPAAALYDLAVRIRADRVVPYRAAIPVICVGNLTAGGTGKTPVALALAEAFATQGLKPAFLTRGYGGCEAGPLAVDPARHSARDVGDEPLLLARAHPTIVSRNRPAGAEAACRLGAGLLIMDDGFQNPSLFKDLGLIVVDAATGFGNGHLIPAGPLREKVPRGLSRAAAVVLLGEGPAPSQLAGFHGAVLRARLVPDDEAAQKLRRQTVFAFAGIGRPQKFFDSLTALGARIGGAVPFPDHHPYSDAEISGLKARAKSLTLVTTEKDFLRLSPAQRGGIETLPVRAVFEDPASLNALLSPITGPPTLPDRLRE
jgi:tetraacyldisaccharide 4'-kinase